MKYLVILIVIAVGLLAWIGFNVQQNENRVLEARHEAAELEAERAQNLHDVRALTAQMQQYEAEEELCIKHPKQHCPVPLP